LVNPSRDREHMRRRQFIALLGGVAAWPLAGRAQTATMPVIGFLDSGSPNEMGANFAGFHKGLGENGFTEGGN